MILKNEDLCRGVNHEEDNIYQQPPGVGQAGPDRQYPFALKEENENSSNKEVVNNYIMLNPPSLGETVNIGLKTKKNDKDKEPTKNPNKKTYADLPGHEGELRNLKNIEKPIIKTLKILKRKADETPVSLSPTKKCKLRTKEHIGKINDQISFIAPTPSIHQDTDLLYIQADDDESFTNNMNSETLTNHASMKHGGHLSRIKTPNQRIYSNIVKKPVHPDPRGNSSTVQKKKIQSGQKVSMNKTTIQKPENDKQKEDDKYKSKLRLAMKTWLEQTRSSK